MYTRLHLLLQHHQPSFHTVVDFDPASEQLLRMDFSTNNTDLTPELVNPTQLLNAYIEQLLIAKQCRYGIGGYNEERILYQRSRHFDGEQNRTVHLGVDIWGAAGTAVYAPLGGIVHSSAYNDHFGDYGATLILQHQLDGVTFHTLYGHLSLADITNSRCGRFISRGEQIGIFGKPEENGDWPPHLHFQVIEDMELREGDYPGVCTAADRERYLLNCPDPDIILQLMQFAGNSL